MELKINILKSIILIMIPVIILSGCATKVPRDYTQFRAADPKTILILPPLNSTPDVKATYGFYSHTQKPLAEAGFYILPISLVDETFKSNGLTVPADIHQVNKEKLQSIFGADAALYIDVKSYGTQYFILGSASIVTAEAKLIDLKSGIVLWNGIATASSEEGKSNQGGLAALLITAALKQVIGSVTDESYNVAKMTNMRLLSAGAPNGVMYGPSHPMYKK